MSLPIFPLHNPLEEATAVRAESFQHEKVPDATQYSITLPEGACLIPVWQDVVHEVIYQIPLDDEIAIQSRNAELFDAYGEGFEWHEVLDNGFGKTYRRRDEERFALGSYVMDYDTFGTMGFHKVLWG